MFKRIALGNFLAIILTIGISGCSSSDNAAATKADDASNNSDSSENSQTTAKTVKSDAKANDPRKEFPYFNGTGNSRELVAFIEKDVGRTVLSAVKH